FASGSTPDRTAAEKSERAYETIWRWAGSWYAGVNAAAMALVADDEESATRLAAEVLKRLPDTPKDYWAAATRAEAFFLSGDREKGAAALSVAAAASDATDSSKASTALQLHRLAPVIGVDANEIGARLMMKTVALVAGHLFRGAEMNAATQAQ